MNHLNEIENSIVSQARPTWISWTKAQKCFRHREILETTYECGGIIRIGLGRFEVLPRFFSSETFSHFHWNIVKSIRVLGHLSKWENQRKSTIHSLVVYPNRMKMKIRLFPDALFLCDGIGDDIVSTRSGFDRNQFAVEFLHHLRTREICRRTLCISETSTLAVSQSVVWATPVRLQRDRGSHLCFVTLSPLLSLHAVVPVRSLLCPHLPIMFEARIKMPSAAEHFNFFLFPLTSWNIIIVNGMCYCIVYYIVHCGTWPQFP